MPAGHDPEARAERQPLANDDASLVLVLDGRVDNDLELRRDLALHGARLRDRTDAELVLRAYERWGRDAPMHIDGDFAFAVWDARRRELFCARDRFGQKPFCHHREGATFAFASEPHALLALPYVPRALDEGTIAEYLACEWLSLEETFWEGVLRLPQAQRMSVDARGARIDTYWTPDLDARLPCRTDDECAEHYRGLLFEAVRRQSRTIGPLACEVSGGLDSSALVAVAERLRREGRLLASSLDAYTLDFRGDPGADEHAYVQAMRDHLAVPIRAIAPTHRRLDWYRERARRFGVFPSFPNGTMGLAIREAARERGSRALVVGVGGDEWLDGSPACYADLLAARQWSTLASAFAADVRDRGALHGSAALVRQAALAVLPGRVVQPIRRVRASLRERRADRSSWLTPRMQRLLHERRERFRARAAPDARTQAQRRLFNTLASPFLAQARETEEGLAAGEQVEVRRPYFERELVEFAFATPDHLKQRGNMGKRLHRLALRTLLPEAVRTRESKADFMLTFLRHRPAFVAEHPGADAGARAGWVVADRIEGAWARFADPHATDARDWRLWALFGCSAWNEID